MIWHIYGKDEKVVIHEQQHQMMQHTYAPSSSSEDTIMQTDEEGDSSAPEDVDLVNKNKPLFLNFTSDLSPQPMCANKRKKTSTTTSYTNAQPAFKVNGVNLLNR